jgi:hypothetical protein
MNNNYKRVIVKNQVKNVRSIDESMSSEGTLRTSDERWDDLKGWRSWMGENMSFEGDPIMGPPVAGTFPAMLGVFGRTDRGDDGD